MKTKLLMIVLLFVGAMMSCNEEPGVTTPPIDELQNESDVVRLTNIRNQIQSLMNMGPTQRSNDFEKQPEGGRSSAISSNAKVRFAYAKTEPDSTDWNDEERENYEESKNYEEPENYESCATITHTENANGSFTIIVDYGVDGCKEYGTLIKGKIIDTFSFKNSLTYKTIYEGISYDSMVINGTISGTFTLHVNEKDLSDYAHSSSWKEDLIVSIVNGESYKIKSDFSEEYKDDKLVMKGSYEGQESNGDAFSFVISSPLVHDFSCYEEDVFVPVQGIESCTYNDEVFNIDYGSGTCDNIATIIENGKGYEIDLAKEWAEDGEEDIEG